MKKLMSLLLVLLLSAGALFSCSDKPGEEPDAQNTAAGPPDVQPAAEEADEETGPADAAGAASGIGASEPAKPAATFGPGIGKPSGQSSI